MFLTLPLCVFSQDKFTGIGIFKIGVDTSAVYSYASEANLSIGSIDDELKLYRIKIANDQNDLLKKESVNAVYKLKRGKRLYSLNTCPSVAEFYINEYEVSGVKLYNVRLEFLNNRLIRVKCNNNKPIRDAMTVKYGPPILTRTSNKIECVYKATGIREEKTEDTFYEKWSNGNISATGCTSSYYNDKCERKFLNYFVYEVESIEEKKCKDDFRSGQDGPQVKKEQLKDF